MSEVMGVEIWVFLIALIIGSFILGAFFLWLALKIVATPEERSTFGSVLITALINALIPCCIIQWYIIKVRHTDYWGPAIAAWFLSWLIPFAIVLGVLAVVAAA